MNGKARNRSVTAVDSAITATEDTPYTFKVADFGFSAAVAADTLASVTITSLPSDGTLALNGTAIADGQVITAAELAALDRQRAQKEAERATLAATIAKLDATIPILQERVNIRKGLSDKELVP
jgi:hypothetical protein